MHVEILQSDEVVLEQSSGDMVEGRGCLSVRLLQNILRVSILHEKNHLPHHRVQTDESMTAMTNNTTSHIILYDSLNPDGIRQYEGPGSSVFVTKVFLLIDEIG